MSARPLIVLGTVVLSGFFIGSGLAQLLAPELASLPPAPLAHVALEHPDAPSLLLGHLFAPVEPPPPEVRGLDEPDDACDVAWRLVGTMLDHDEPTRSFGAFHTPAGARLLATSMTHTELTLVELHSETATLEHTDGQRCQLRMFSQTHSTIVETIPDLPAPPRDPRVRLVSSSHVQIDMSLLDAPGALGVRPIPVMRDGRLSGVRLVGVRRSSPLAAAGVQNGDVISAVDGRTLASPDVALAALGRLRGGEPVQVTIERDGAAREMTLSTARPR